MAAFRRCVIVLAVLAVFAGLAGAQQLAPMVCSATVPTATTLRAEGISDLIGDIVISCSGGAIAVGNAPANYGQAASTANFVVTLPSAITSRLTQSAGAGVNTTDALLTIDDPTNSGAFGGFGSGAPFVVCNAVGLVPKGTAAGSTDGCTATFVGDGPNGAVIASATGASGSGSPGSNTYQGVIGGTGGNILTFYGVPIVPPVSNGVLRTFRITNVRMTSVGLTGAQTASVAVNLQSPTTTLSFSASGQTATSVTPTIATVASSYTASISNGTTGGGALLVCTPGGTGTAPNTLAGMVSFAETANNGFRARFGKEVATATEFSLQGAGVAGVLAQPTPGGTYSGTESGLTVTLGGTNTPATAGLADFGTRLRVAFSGVPKGVSLYVSYTNVTAAGAQGLVDPTPGTGVAGSTTAGTNSLAILLAQANNETTADGTPFSTPFAVPSFTSGAWTAGADITTAGFAYKQVTITIPTGGTVGTGTAVWEVVDQQAASLETMNFGIYAVYAAGAIAPGQAITVGLSTGPSTTTTANPAPLPRFTAGTTSGAAATFTTCQTSLLFPYIQTASLFETGIAISNTSADPFGTATQAGNCLLSFYGSPATPSVTIPKTGDPYLTTYPGATTITAGTTWANISSAYAPGFTGYAIAVCNFQMAHGFSFIAYNGNSNEAMGYLALVLKTAGGRTSTTNTNESLSH